VLFSVFFFRIIIFTFIPPNGKSAVTELRIFESLFLVMFQACSLVENHHFARKTFFAEALVKILILQVHVLHWAELFTVNNPVEQDNIVAAIRIDIFIFTHFSCTETHVRSKPSSDFALSKTSTPK